MRLSQYKQHFIKTFWKESFPNSKVYLFGSRTDDAKKGGDIDLLILNDEKIDLAIKIDFLGKFWEEFGEQKVDVVTYTFNDNSKPFKFIALHTAIEI